MNDALSHTMSSKIVKYKSWDKHQWIDRFNRYLWKQFARYSSRINSGWHWQPGIYNCLCAWLEVDVQRRLIKRLRRRRLDDAFAASAAVANVTPFIDDLLNVSARQSAAPRRAAPSCDAVYHATTSTLIPFRCYSPAPRMTITFSIGQLRP